MFRTPSCLRAAIAFGLVLLAVPRPVAAGESYAFDFELESDDVPDIDSTLAITGEPGESVRFFANLIIGSAGLAPDADGVQGWSLSVWHAEMDAEFLTVEGTVSALETDGGLRPPGEDNSFLRFETVDRDRNDGRRGTVQAVVLSMAGQSVTLPPNTRQVVGRIQYHVIIGETPRVAFFRYEDGLVGAGQPVPNALTVDGATQLPTLASRDIAIGAGAVPESGDACTDGIDNDGDSWADALDPGCGEFFGGEDCSDGVDNDDDGLVDCDDPSCSRNAACVEACGDGVDNDGDGAIDCDDVDCLGHPSCGPVESCDDGIDNDDDGLADCDDPQCALSPGCRVPEVCDDGIDNDGDGNVDCDDTECAGRPPCPVPERCSDGVDNDEDGFVDCDDVDCANVAGCLRREDCGDGIDNDFDGRVDCDDVDCSGVGRCPSEEICDNGVDDDGDGLVDCDDRFCRDSIACGADDGFDLVLYAEGAVRRGEGGAERNVVAIAPGADAFEAVVYAVPAPRPQPEGIQGWSLSVALDRSQLRFVSATIDGTDAAMQLHRGFERTEGAWVGGHPGAPGEEADGFVSAVVLSFVEPITLDPSAPQSLVRARYELVDGAVAGDGVPSGAAAGFADGLTGSGQPVTNLFTVRGATHNPRRRIPLEIRRGSRFRRGDANDDARVDLADAIWILNELVRDGPRTPCRLAADANDDARVDVSDAIWIAHYRFLHGPPPPAPFPACGIGARTALGCPEEYVCH